jgi:gluconokinase
MPAEQAWHDPSVVVVMGVSGCGKTTIAAMLAHELHWIYEDADWFHPKSNIDKMHGGEPLTDEDRWPWLQRIRDWIDEREAGDGAGIVTCSALRRRYRDVLRDDHVYFVYLHGTREQLLARLTARQGHFMPPSLLDSQLATLEPPDHDEQAIRIDIGPAPAVQARTILDKLGLD